MDGSAEKGIIGKIYKFGLENADYIIAQNEEQVSLLQRRVKHSISNIKIIKSGYFMENPKIKDKQYILWVARAVDWKRPEIFLKLAIIFPKEKFLMILIDYNED